MRKITQTIVLLGTVIGYKASAQIGAIVTDRTGSYALKNATVLLQNSNDTALVIHGDTKNNGNFLFTDIVDGKYILSISYVGYNTFTAGIIVVNHKAKTLSDTISLTQAEKDLHSVVVTNKKPFIEFKADKITLNIAESPIAAGDNAYDVIKRAPGVLENNNGLSFKGKSILVLINDKPTYLTAADLKDMLENTPANTIDKVEILPNPSVKYDANAQSIINIKLVKTKNYGLNGSLTTGTGMGDHFRYNGGANLNYRYNKLNVCGSYNYEHNQTYHNNDVDRTLGPGDHIFESSRGMRTRDNNSYKIGTDYDINKNSSFGFLFNGYTNNRDMVVEDNTTSTHSAPLTDSFSNVATAGHARFSNNAVNVYYKSIFDTLGKTLNVNWDYLNYSKQWDDDITTKYYDIDKLPYLPPYLLRDKSPSNNNVFSFAVDYINPIKNGSITAGIKSVYTSTDNDVRWQYQSNSVWLENSNLTNHFKYKENVNAAYVCYGRTFNKYELIVGLRTEQTNIQGNSVTLGQVHDSSYWGFFPNISVQYTKNTNNVFVINYRKSVLRPNFGDINPFVIYQTQYSYMVGNPSLKPEYDNDITITYTYKQALNLSLDYTHSLNSISNLIVGGINNSVGTSIGNVHGQDQFSFSSIWNHKIKGCWDISLSNIVLFDRNTVLNTNGTVLDNARWSYIGQWGNMFTMGKGWTAQLSASYQSAIAYSIYTLYGNFHADMGLQKSIMKNKAKVALSVSDLFNTNKLRLYTNFNGIDEATNYKNESRFLKLQFTYKFGNKKVKPKTDRSSSIEDMNKRMGQN